MKKILNILKEKWPEYLLEILVLIIGIYGAFAVEAWNENRIIAQQEKVFSKNLLNDLKDDASQFSYYSETYAAVEELHVQLYQIGILEQSLDSIVEPTFIRRSLYFKQLINQDFLDSSVEIEDSDLRNELVKYVRVISAFEDVYWIELVPMINHSRQILEDEEVYNAGNWFKVKSKVFDSNFRFSQIEGQNLVDKDKLVSLAKTRAYQQILFQLNMKWNEFNTRLLEAQAANRSLQEFIESEFKTHS